MKKRIFLYLSIVLASLLVASCTQQQPTYHSMPTFDTPKTTSGNQCVQRCLEQKKSCDTHCGANHEQCLMQQKKLANQRYVSYVNEMVQINHKIERKESDFIDYEECSSSCECIKSYKNCYLLCGGAVTEHKVCISNCN